jgi:hypothetical protein
MTIKGRVWDENEGNGINVHRNGGGRNQLAMDDQGYISSQFLRRVLMIFMEGAMRRLELASQEDHHMLLNTGRCADLLATMVSVGLHE